MSVMYCVVYTVHMYCVCHADCVVQCQLPSQVHWAAAAPRLCWFEISLDLANPRCASHGCTLQELLPTPAKSHYTFNLRDLAKVMQGVLSAESKCVKNKKDFLRLYIHESTRVFRCVYC